MILGIINIHEKIYNYMNLLKLSAFSMFYCWMKASCLELTVSSYFAANRVTTVVNL